MLDRGYSLCPDSLDVTKKAYKGGSQAPHDPPLATPLSILVTNLKGQLYLWNALD